MEKTITYLFLALSLMMFTFAALQLTPKRKTRVNINLCALFSILGYIWLYYGWYRTNQLAEAPRLLYSDVAVTFLAGPVLYDYIKNLTGRPVRSLPLKALPFIPALAVAIYLIAQNPGSRIYRTTGINPDHFAVHSVDVINTLGDIHFFCYVTVSTLIIRHFQRTLAANAQKAFRGVARYFINALFTFTLFFAGHVLKNDNILALAVLLNGINSAYFFFLSYRYPELTQKPVRSSAEVARPPPPIKGLDIPAILASLKKIVEENKGYKNPDLSLQALSTRLGIQNHQLTLILNEYIGTNFRNYINRRRIQEAERLLTQKTTLSILDVAFEVGFNSKSVFNAAFIRETGLSPTAYREKIRKTS